MRIVSVAPTRIGLIGGGTDVDPFSLTFGGKVLNIAINLCVETVLTARAGSAAVIEAMGEKRSFDLSKKPARYGKDPKFDLVRAVIDHFRSDIPSGFKLKSEAKFESVGLGGSGAAAVSMIGAFNLWLGKGMSRLDIATLAFLLETEELGWPGGIQDQMAAAFGGINVIPFGFAEDFGAVPVSLDEGTIKEFRRQMMIVFMGGYRHSKDQQSKLSRGMSEGEKQKALIRLREGVVEAVEAIKKRDWEDLGNFLDEAWEDKKRSNPSATNETIDEFYGVAKSLGMLGGKVMGAGGAGHLFMLVPAGRQRVMRKALVEKGARVVDFEFDFSGLRVNERR